MTWRAIDDQAKNGEDVLLCDGRTGVCLVASWNTENADVFPWDTMDGPSYATKWPTHWQPLPAPPEE